MKIIPIDPTPNQSLSVVLDNSFYTLRLETRGTVVTMDIVKDGIKILEGARVVAFANIVQSKYLLPKSNFMITTIDGDIVDPSKFGISQFLYYYNNSEIPPDAPPREQPPYIPPEPPPEDL